MPESRIIFVPRYKFGQARCAKLIVRETAKLYIVESTETVLGSYTGIFVGSHLHKANTPAFEDLRGALVWLQFQNEAAIESAESKIATLREQRQQLDELLAQGEPNA